MQEVVKYPHCFVCGDQNPHGLKAKIFFDGTEAFCELDAVARFEGYAGIYHGGIISTLLDEVMIKAVLAEEKYALTAELTVRFHSPVEIGERLRVSGRVIKRRGRIFLAEGRIVASKGRLCASASAKYIEAGPEMKKDLLNSLK